MRLGQLQWLVFRNDGTTTAAQWGQQASQAGLGGGLFSVFDRGRAERRQAFALEVLRQTLKVSQFSALYSFHHAAWRHLVWTLQFPWSRT